MVSNKSNIFFLTLMGLAFFGFMFLLASQSSIQYSPKSLGKTSTQIDYSNLCGQTIEELSISLSGANPSKINQNKLSRIFDDCVDNGDMSLGSGGSGGGESCPADLNGDGTVRAADLALLLGSWGPCADPDDCPADLDGDGIVRAADLAILLGNWGECPVTCPTMENGFAGGSGTTEDPYLVCNSEQLQLLEDFLGISYHFLQTADINMSGVSDFRPIGQFPQTFSSHYNGDDYKIKNLHLEIPQTDSAVIVGLFAQLGSLSNITRVHLENVTVSGEGLGTVIAIGTLAGFSRGSISHSSAQGTITTPTMDHVGGLVGILSDSIEQGPQFPAEILFSSSSVDVEGDNSVGGLVASSLRGIIHESHATGHVIAHGNSAGGLASFTDTANISNSYATGDVDGFGTQRYGGLVGLLQFDSLLINTYATGQVSGGNFNVGGLVGESRINSVIEESYSSGTVLGLNSAAGLVGYNHIGSNIIRSYSTSEVSGNNNVGGLVGHLVGGTVEDSYAQGSVDGNIRVGGLVGHLLEEGSIVNSYSTGFVSNVSLSGGLVGINENGTIDASFWDTETSNMDTSDGGVGLLTELMQMQSTYNPPWNFDTVWDIIENETYPFLRWQNN